MAFSRSQYTRFSKGKAPLRQTNALRILEERRAARIAGYKVSFLPLAEAFARPGFGNLDDLFSQKQRPEDQTGWEELRDFLRPIIQAHRGLILASLGCGGHIDHRTMKACFIELVWQLPETIPALYEDLPYAALCSDKAIRALVPPDWRGSPLVPVALQGGSIEEKLQLLGVYRSQLTKKDLRLVRQHWDRRKGSEVLWVPEARVGEIFSGISTTC